MDESRKLSIAILLDLIKHSNGDMQDIKLGLACLNHLGINDAEIYTALDASEEDIKQHIAEIKHVMDRYEVTNRKN